MMGTKISHFAPPPTSLSLEELLSPRTISTATRIWQEISEQGYPRAYQRVSTGYLR
jgi:hypothetical protein